MFQGKSRIVGQKVKDQSEVTGLDPPKEFFYVSSFEGGVTGRYPNHLCNG